MRVDSVASSCQGHVRSERKFRDRVLKPLCAESARAYRARERWIKDANI